MTSPMTSPAGGWWHRLALAVLFLTASGCIVFTDKAGIPLAEADGAWIQAGRTSRDEVLLRLGPPTGYFTTDLTAVVTRLGTPLAPGWAGAGVDDDVFTYQEVDIRGKVAFFPILFTWLDAHIETRTLIVFFDEAGVVEYVAYREDES